MAISYVNKSAFASGTGALSVGAVSGVAADDLILLFVESENQDVATPSGYTEVTGSPVSLGTAASTSGVRLTVFYRWATGADTTTSVADSGNHTTAIKLAFRGVDPTAPFDATPVTGTKTTASTTATFPGITTATANAWVVLASALNLDAASTATTGTPANANLSSLTERHDQTITSSNGGGLVLITGTKAAAGATGNTTATVTSTTQVYMTLALREYVEAPVQDLESFASVSATANATLTQTFGIWLQSSAPTAATATATLTYEASSIELVQTLTGTDTITPTLFEAGDLVLAMAFRDGSTTPPTAPPGWTTLATEVGTECSAVLASRDTSGSGTFTDATSVIAHVYRPAVPVPLTIGNVDGISGVGATVDLPALALSSPSSNPFRVGFAGHSEVGAEFPQLVPVDNLWTQRTLPASEYWASVAYGNGLFVAVTDPGDMAATSLDGINWTLRTLPASANWVAVTYGNGLFVAFATGNTAATSPDGITWTFQYLPVYRFWRSATYVNGLFVAVATSSDYAITSPDGLTWDVVALPLSTNWWAVTCGGGLFVALSYNTTIAATSPDGVNWTQRSIPFGNWRSVTYGNGIFVAVAEGTYVVTSPDGINWTERTLPVSYLTFSSVSFGNGLFVAVALGSDVAVTSPDGITWTQQTLPISGSWRGVTYGNGLFAAVAADSNVAATATFAAPSLSRLRAAAADATDVVASYDSGGPELQSEV